MKRFKMIITEKKTPLKSIVHEAIITCNNRRNRII